jgi:ankyrin repeat protein
MKNLFLTSLCIVALSVNANATNFSENETSIEKANSTYETLAQTKVNTFCKLIQMGDVNAIKNLITTGANINQKSVGLTPLMYAARHNKIEIVKLLISRGAKLKIKSDKGFTALKYAEISKATDAYELIKKALDA